MFEQRLHVHSQPAPLHPALGHDLLGDASGEVAGNGTGQAETDFVDPDDFSAQVDERTTGIAAVNGSIVSNPPHQRADVFTVQLEAGKRSKEPRHNHLGVADDAQRDRLRQSHRTAHCQHVVAHPHFGGITEPGGSEVAGFFGLQFENGDVGERVRAHEFRFDFLVARQGVEHPYAVPGHMVVGDQITVLGDDRPAADGLHFHLAPFVVLGRHDLNAHEGRLHPGDGQIDLRPQTRHDLLPFGEAALSVRQEKQTEDKKQPPGNMEMIGSSHGYRCRASARACKFRILLVWCLGNY